MAKSEKPQAVEPNYLKIREVLSEVAQERQRQHDKWGEQNYPDAEPTILRAALHPEDRARRIASDLEIPTEIRGRQNCQRAFAGGRGSFATVLVEEVSEAAGAIGDDDKLREELIQIAAVAVCWVEAIDRRNKA